MKKKKNNQKKIDQNPPQYVDAYTPPMDFNYSGYGSVDYDDSFSVDPETALNSQQNLNSEIYHKITGKLFKRQYQNDYGNMQSSVAPKRDVDFVDEDTIDDFVPQTSVFNARMQSDLDDEEDKIDSYKDDYQQPSFNIEAVDNVIKFINYVLSDEDKEDARVVEDPGNTQEFDEYQILLKQLKISENTLTAILQEITGQESLEFNYVRKNVDGSVIFFKDENDHIFSVPYQNILEYTKILNG